MKTILYISTLLLIVGCSQPPAKPAWIPKDATILTYQNTRGWLDSGQMYISIRTSPQNIRTLIDHFSGEAVIWTTNNQYIYGHVKEHQGKSPWSVVVDTSKNEFTYSEN